jgi:hypothetical protein
MSRTLVAIAYGNAEVIPVVACEHNGRRYGIDLSISSMYILIMVPGVLCIQNCQVANSAFSLVAHLLMQLNSMPPYGFLIFAYYCL